MKTLKAKKLSREEFTRYGTYHDMLNMDTDRLGPPPVEFYRDILQVEFGHRNPSFSVTQITPRPFVAEKFEYHSYTGEAFMPLDGDALVHLAPAGKRDLVPYEKIEVFLVPQGTMVVLNPGVWHAAPFSKEDKMIHVLTVLPERTYANDCQIIEFPGEEKIQIQE